MNKYEIGDGVCWTFDATNRPTAAVQLSRFGMFDGYIKARTGPRQAWVIFEGNVRRSRVFVKELKW